jgi:hypothetical protein
VTPAAAAATAASQHTAEADAGVDITQAASDWRSYSTLPVGVELMIELQEELKAGYYGNVASVQVVGQARVRVQQLLGGGGMADAYLCQLLSYEADTSRIRSSISSLSSSSSRPPEQLVVKLAHPQRPDAFPSPEDFVGWASLQMWQEYKPLSALSCVDEVIRTYGFGMAAAADSSSIYGLGPTMPCLLLEWAELGDLW